MKDAQAQLVAWIWGQPGAEPPPALRPLGAQGLTRGLSAYREHAKALAVRALAARFPLVQAWMGEQEFAGLAWAFARQHPPREGDLAAWGGEMPAFLATLPGMEPQPPQLAAIDDALHQGAAAADEPAPDAGLWTQLQQVDPSTLRLRWSAHLRLLPLSEPMAEWLAEGNEALDAPSRHLLVWRRGFKPCRGWLADDAAHWLSVQARSANLGEAIEVQQAVYADFDFGAALARAWHQGWLLGADETSAAPTA